MTKTISQTVSNTVQDTATGFKDMTNIGQLSQTFTGQGGGGPGIVNVGLSEETISFGDVAPGLIMMRNLSPTNFVTWGNYTGELGQKLAPQGIWTVIELVPGSDLIMQADTGACNVHIKAFDA